MTKSRIALLIGGLILGVALVALAADYLNSGSVQPSRGTSSTIFTYYVYWSGTGDPPTAYVHIDGLGAIMMNYDQEIGGSHRYKYQTTLPSGDHSFYFTDSDGGRDPNVGVYVGPHVED